MLEELALLPAFQKPKTFAEPLLLGLSDFCRTIVRINRKFYAGDAVLDFRPISFVTPISSVSWPVARR
jgi:hypothetical protein